MNVSKQKQQGYSLFLVMILMLVIAFLVIATSQSSLTESRASANEADRKLALSYAETGLRDAETKILELEQGSATVSFSSDCKTAGSIGMCKPADNTYTNNAKAPFEYGSGSSTTEAWERPDVLDSAGDACIRTPDNNACYIVEYLGYQSSEDKEVFRVTSRARGQSDNTVVTLQSYVELVR